MTAQGQSPNHYLIPNEEGYFPAGSDEARALLAKIDKAKIYQIHPRSDDDDDKLDEPLPLADGTLALRDPDAGTADDVVLVVQCGDIIFYVMDDDATSKTSDSEFVIMLPKDCLLVDLTGCSETDVLRVESLLAARTKFHDKTTHEAAEPSSASPAVVYPENLPDDTASRLMFRASCSVSRMIVTAGEMGASKIDAYGEKKREGVTEGRDVKVGKTGIMLAKGTRTVSEKAYDITERVSEKLSDVLGGRLGRAAAIKEGDSKRKRRARSLLLASTISYAEIGSGASGGYEAMVRSAQSQATEFVAKKYGGSAAELCRHTAGAAANFGRAALTARRVVNVKKIAKSAGKQMVKESIKNSVL